MKLALERHAYAPELNRLWIHDNRGRLVAIAPAPGCSTIAQARNLHFARPLEPGRRVTLRYERPAPWSGLNREYSGIVPQGLAGLSMLAIARADCRGRHMAGGRLIDGQELPAATESVSFGPAVYTATDCGTADYFARARARDRRNWHIGPAALARAA